ncbi:MAG: acetolactate synthase small subunit [Clostridiales bacterium]|nr:acetolactate synthase small subunit [Clostridiales bacterium]
MKKHLITALVKNQSGVLTRISGLFARRCFNIDSLAVCNTEDERFSRMTIVSTGDDATINQVIKQLDKLVDVIKVSELDVNSSVLRELLLVKINVAAPQRPEIEMTCKVYKAKIIDLSPESIVAEITGEPGKIDGFLKVIKPYGIIEMARTGLTALERGAVSINDLTDYNELV